MEIKVGCRERLYGVISRVSANRHNGPFISVIMPFLRLFLIALLMNCRTTELPLHYLFGGWSCAICFCDALNQSQFDLRHAKTSVSVYRVRMAWYPWEWPIVNIFGYRLVRSTACFSVHQFVYRLQFTSTYWTS